MQHLPYTLAKCPDCGSTGKRCKRPSEHDAQNWHISRENVYARMHPNCAACQAWLRAGHE